MRRDIVLKLPHKSLILKREAGEATHSGSPQSLRAWDAADEQLIEEVQSRPEGRLAIADDTFGALSLGMAERTPTVVADSAMLPAALARNAALNNLTPPMVFSWRQPPEGPFDQVVIKIPRQLDYLEYLLRWANDVLAPTGTLIAGAMIKHLPTRCADLFKSLMASNQPRLAQRKARVILATPGPAGLNDFAGLWKGYELSKQELDKVQPGTTTYSLEALPAVFARDQLDIGTRVFLAQVKAISRSLQTGARVLDLGCGNGAVGLTALSERSDLAVDFADVSSQAVASAQRNINARFADAKSRFFHHDGVPELSHDARTGGYDLILCNPPFHEGGVVGDHIALRLFQESASALRPGGRLLIVGNRHLAYHKKLRRWFNNVEQIADHPKFIVLIAS